MTDADGMDERRLLHDAIVRIVKETFEKRRQVVLLSFVGQNLSREGINFREILGEQGLAAYVQSDLADELEVIATPNDAKVLGTYPRGIDLSQEIDPFGRQRRTVARSTHLEVDRSGNSKLRVNRFVWFAFSHPLADNSQRVLRFSPMVEYQDVPEAEDAPEGIPVPKELIVPFDKLSKEERDDQIYANIMSWAKQNDIDVSAVTSVPRAKETRRSVLEVLLGALRPQDLERISMPLDVVNLLRLARV